MRGIEGALCVLQEVEKGAFASEALRKVWGEITPNERKLAATLSYLTLRRFGLWKHILGKYCKRSPEALHPRTVSFLLPGIAGVLELRHFKPGVLVNALVSYARRLETEIDGYRDAALINAVLHTVMEKAPAYIESLRKAPALRDQALGEGVPGWAAAEWNKDWGMKDAKRLLQLSAAQTCLSVRMSPGEDARRWAEAYGEHGEHPAQPSDAMPGAVRIDGNPYPPDLPGYAEGRVTPQSEASMWAVETLLGHWQGDTLLDMCMGRGVKAAHILSYRPDVRTEGWELSSARLGAAEREFRRLGVEERAIRFCGDATAMVPACVPSAILLDAPCSGSGTWGRHPEGKWRTNPQKLSRMADLQRRLFARAADILAPGGVMLYCTCSIFREENEKVVGAVMAARADLVEIPLRRGSMPQVRGKPYGSYVLPENPWTDGFFLALLKKK